MSYHDALPREYTVPVICRIKRIFWDRGQKFYELEPIVLPERGEHDSEMRVSEVRKDIRAKE